MPARFRSPVPRVILLTPLGVVFVLCLVATGADPPTLEEDLKALQGTWERTQVLPGQPGPQSGRVVKEVKGNRETVTSYDGSGAETYAHTVEFRLQREGNVRVFTFFNREVIAGPAKGQKVAEPASYLYRLRGDTFEEVWGFLPGQERRELLAAKWRRVGGRDAQRPPGPGDLAQREAPGRMPILDTFQGTVANDKRPEVKNVFVATAAGWKDVWAKVNPKEKLPDVDFTRHFLLISRQDAADPNRRTTSIFRDDDGVVTLEEMSTLIGYESSDRTVYRFYKVSREGVTGVRSFDPAKGKPVVDPLPK